MCSSVSGGFNLPRISSFLWKIFAHYVLSCIGNTLVFALRGTAAYGTCKVPALSVNHAAKYSKDCFSVVVFVDTLAGKLDMWMCMAELAQVNLSKMELGGNIYPLISPSVIFHPHRLLFTYVYIFLSFFNKVSTNKLNYPRPPPSPTPLYLSSQFYLPFFPLSYSYSLPRLQLLGNRWLSMRGMQLTN